MTWFKKFKKLTKEKLASYFTDWYSEKEEKRGGFVVLFDEDEGTTTGALCGKHGMIVNSIVNEMIAEENVRDLLFEAISTYVEVTRPQEENVEEKPKSRRKKTTKVVS